MVYKQVMMAGSALLQVLVLGGCGDTVPADKGVTQASVSATPTSATAPLPAPTPAAPVAKASVVEVKTPDYEFTYRYPAAAAAIPQLASWLDEDRATARAGVARDSAEDRQGAEKAGFPYRRHAAFAVWKVVTETPRLLSLSGETYTYTGGAHGSPGFRAILWDKTRSRRIAPEEVFASPAAIQAATGDAFCGALDRERARRRGAPVVRDADTFSNCPRVAEATTILGSSDRRTIDRIGFLVGPYVAGPYSEGSYDLTLPVTPAVVMAVREDYRDAFTAR